jgi:hypothetical protein
MPHSGSEGDLGWDWRCERERPLSIVTFPISIFVALVGQMDMEQPVPGRDVQMEILATGFKAQPPVIVRHLLKVEPGSNGNNLVEGWGPSVKLPCVRISTELTFFFQIIRSG